MSRFFVSPDTPDGWASGLARPDHWREGYSAHSLAVTWHQSDGFPTSVGDALRRSELGPLDFLSGIPEYKVALPGGDAASQTDLFVLARSSSDETVVIAVEGKALEAFGDSIVADWRRGGSEGKQERLEFLLRILGLDDDDVLGEQRYQLLHRTASPIIEAARLNATHSVVLVHSFGGENKWFDVFANFASLFGADVKPGSIVRATRAPRSLFFGWVSDPHPRAEEPTSKSEARV